MPTLKNSVVINASIERIWSELSNLEKVAKHDPLAKTATILGEQQTGVNSRRKVEMSDGKNWFEETCTVFKENESIKFELSACSFPVHSLHHEYQFRKITETQTEVSQIQSYVMKYGILGKVMGAMIKSKWKKGVIGFLDGLKKHSES